ncbi:MAG: HPr family phosphocarrier protein [Pseudomonadales bacterium]
MLTATLEIVNRLGLHARAASRLVSTARVFKSNIRLTHGKSEADAKSIMSVLLLAAPQGAALQVTIEGPDALDALEALRALIDSRFGEPE